MNGRPLTINWERDNADALLEAWYPGTEGGHAIADVLFGDENPSGKLPISFPRSLGQIPTYYNHLRIGRPFTPGKPPNYTSQYFEEESGPLYPFGYGLSYTTFSLSDVALSGQALPRNGQITASVTVKNTGTREERNRGAALHPGRDRLGGAAGEGAEGLPQGDAQAGRVRVVSFPIGEDKLRFYNGKLEYVAEPGDFNVQIGLDSASVRQQRFTLQP